MRERARELLKRVSERAKERARANIFEILHKFKKAIDVSRDENLRRKKSESILFRAEKKFGKSKTENF